MINFFRNFRRQFANDNKPLQYLRYALGEIVLVVIGILIALQINDWNDVRKRREKELSYLERLKEEFEANLAQTEANLVMSNTYLELTETALKVFSNETIVTVDTLAVAVEWASYGSPSNIKDNVWQDLVSSGNSDLISNSQLRFEISEYFNWMELHWDLYRNNWVDDHNDTHDLTSTILSWRDRNSVAESFSSLMLSAVYTPPKISTDFAALKNKLKDLPNIESKLYTMFNLHQISVSFDEKEIVLIKNILKSLDDEIERFQ